MDINDWTRKHMPNFNEFFKQIEASADKRHGGPWDRGGADCYYGRGPSPHYYEDHTYASPRITRENMTEQQIDEYFAGYTNTQRSDARKDWN